ncbi:winged helix DNA-binding domain-containing protein [Streptomyces parvulus]|uniref:winged helix DNA-binding domain-containing protein n=1 Tax=Streptomyces parvulus TaxID=146923 RepID=UPI0033B4CF09
MRKSTGITWAAASARRLERQFLAKSAQTGAPGADTATDMAAGVAAAMLGAHAQVLSAAELSIGLRTENITRSDVRRALWPAAPPPAPASACVPAPAPSLVKTHGPRGTVHLLPARDLPMWCAALTAVPDGPASFAPDVRLDDELAGQVVTAIGDALDGRFLTIDELGEEVVARTGPWAGDLVMPAFQTLWPRWRQVLHRAGQCGALSFGPHRGRRVTYTRPPRFTPLPPEEATRLLVRRYLRAYGPATPRHFARWLAAPPGWARDVFAGLAREGEIEEVAFGEPGSGEAGAGADAGAEGSGGSGGAGTSAWVAAGDTVFPDAPERDELLRGVRLLPYFDAYVIAAQPRELLFPGAARERALAGGQAGNFPVLMVDGTVAGVWHQLRRGRRTTVTVEPLSRLTARQERELAARVEQVGRVLETRAELVTGEVSVGPHA